MGFGLFVFWLDSACEEKTNDVPNRETLREKKQHVLCALAIPLVDFPVPWCIYGTRL